MKDHIYVKWEVSRPQGVNIKEGTKIMLSLFDHATSDEEVFQIIDDVLQEDFSNKIDFDYVEEIGAQVQRVRHLQGNSKAGG